jgi:hypothetical protein
MAAIGAGRRRGWRTQDNRRPSEAPGEGAVVLAGRQPLERLRSRGTAAAAIADAGRGGEPRGRRTGPSLMKQSPSIGGGRDAMLPD